nr:MAG TPA: hypothetical protein [Caudoviricetes sp.]
MISAALLFKGIIALLRPLGKHKGGMCDEGTIDK